MLEEGLPEFESEMHRQSSRGAANSFRGLGFLNGGVAELGESCLRAVDAEDEGGAARAEIRGGRRTPALREKTRRQAAVGGRGPQETTGDGAGSGGEA